MLEYKIQVINFTGVVFFYGAEVFYKSITIFVCICSLITLIDQISIQVDSYKVYYYK
jgi:hypothetical protein